MTEIWQNCQKYAPAIQVPISTFYPRKMIPDRQKPIFDEKSSENLWPISEPYQKSVFGRFLAGNIKNGHFWPEKSKTPDFGLLG